MDSLPVVTVEVPRNDGVSARRPKTASETPDSGVSKSGNAPCIPLETTPTAPLSLSLLKTDENEADEKPYSFAKNPHPFLIGHGESGRVLAVMSSKECQSMAVRLISESRRHVTLSGFTFDSEEITQALRQAATLEKDVRVILDSTQVLKGTTKMMAKRCAELFSSGCKVHLVQDVGVQHSKTLSIDNRYAIVGSCNWTNSSRSNHEISVLLKLDAGVNTAIESKYEEMIKHSRPFKLEDAETGQTTRDARVRAHSASSSSQYRTAKSFSIARSRQASRERMLSGREPIVDPAETRVTSATTA